MKKVYGLLICLMVVLLFAGCGTSSGTSSSSAQMSVEEPGSDATSYYVRANGNDRNAGTSEDAPFRTLTRAINVASRTSLKKITVIGTLTENVSTEDSAASTVKRKNWDDPNPSEILITGKPEAAGNERAVLTASRGHIFTLFNFIAVRFEHIEMSGANGAPAIRVAGGELTLADGVKIINNKNTNGGAGGGILLTHGGLLIMRDNAEISNNEATVGGGFSLGDEGGGTSAILTDNAVVSNNKSDNGGGIVVGNSNLSLTDNAIVKNNTAAQNGGGIILQGGEINLYDNASIINNIAQGSPNSANSGFGGGIFINGGNLYLRDNSSINNNSANLGGGIMGFENAGVYLSGTPKITGNRATIAAGGVFINRSRGGNLFTGQNINFRDIILNNTAPENADVYLMS